MAEKLSPLFRTKAGLLTTYAFRCGYQETIAYNDKRGKLFIDGPYYHVSIFSSNGRRLAWETFERVADARKFMNREVRS